MKATQTTSINQGIQKILNLAESDFQLVRAFIKIYYDNRSKYESTSTFRKIEALVNEIVSELQHVDAFEQRLKHLIDFDHRAHSVDDVSITSSLLHLNFFQLITIESDLFATVSKCGSLLSELQSYLDQASINWFENKAALANFFDYIKRAILVNRTAESKTQIKTLPAEVENNLKSFYSMETERFVLNWFQTRMPHGTSVELLRNYDAYKNILQTNLIEIF